jgi:transposase
MGKNSEVKTILYKFYENNQDLPKKDIAEHFIALGYPKSSVYRWISCLEKKKSLERKKGSGRPAKIASKSNIIKIKYHFNHRSGCSQRKIARRLGCSQSYINYMLKKHTKIRCFKKKKRPLLTDIQKKLARPKCRLMLNEFKGLDFLIDDESYFTLAHTSQSGNDRFYSNDLNVTPDTVMFDFKTKYEQKLLVWLCISPKGVSKPYFIPSGLAVNQEVYLENIIKPYLEPFIEKHYPDGGFVFWPDLASSHYANSVLTYLKSKNIKYVPKYMNPANLPKARPIEDFWGNLKNLVYEGDWSATSLSQLENRIKACLGKMDLSFVQRHAESVRSRLDHIRRHGI